MSIQKVIIEANASINGVEVNNGNTGLQIVEIGQGPKGNTGPQGPAGATGPAGPNSVTSETTSDGTANLSLASIKAGSGAGLIIKNEAGEEIGRMGQDYTGTGGFENGLQFGENCVASGNHSIALGSGCEASGEFSFATGNLTTASVEYAFACGTETTASGIASFAGGDATTASGGSAFAIGSLTESSGQNSFAGGSSTIASGENSYAFGLRAKAIHDGASVESDGQDADVSSTTTDEKTFRFQNGYRFLGGSATFTAVIAPDEVKSSNFTAANGGSYTAVSTLTVTDPTPVEGQGYTVLVRNGTVTVGGTSYATAGSVIRRVFHSGAWANYLYRNAAQFATVATSGAYSDLSGLPTLGTLAAVNGGTGVATALAVNTGTAGAFVVNGGALGTPSSGTLTSCTGLPISTGVTGLGANVATFLATPTSANLAAAVSDETGSGSLVFATSPTITTPTIARSGNGTMATFQDGSGKTVTVETASFGTQITLNGTGGTLGAYLTLNGQLESWVNIISLTNTTDLRVMRFGNGSNAQRDRFSIQRLNDTSTIIRATPFSLANNAPTNSFYMHASGGVSYGNTTDPGAGNIGLNGNQIVIATSQTPASASATGTTGTICWDANYIYVCTATNTWKRTAISTW